MLINRILEQATLAGDNVINLDDLTGECGFVNGIANRQGAQAFPAIDLWFVTLAAQDFQKFPNFNRKAVGCAARVEKFLFGLAQGGSVQVTKTVSSGASVKGIATPVFNERNSA